MIIPILHRIVVKPDNFDEIDETAQYAKRLGMEVVDPNSANVRKQASVDKGKIVSIGPTAFKDFGTSSPVAIGDYVAYARNAGKPIKDPYTDEEFIALNDEDICVIFKN